MASFTLTLADYRIEDFSKIAQWRGYETIERWLGAVLETAIDIEFDSYFDEEENE